MHLIFDTYSNLDRRFIWCETKPLATERDLKAADRMYHKIQKDDTDRRMCQAQLLRAKNTPETVGRALTIYENIREPRASVGRARCYLRLDRQRDATRQLNGLIHEDVTKIGHQDLVESFLMMTYISLKEGTLDEASKYVRQALDLNGSSGRAWEMAGLVAERKKDFAAAAEAFRHSWELTGRRDSAIGFKLAQNHMRANEPVKAIKICEGVLAIRPNYPKIKESVLLPCCEMLRP